MQLKEYLVNTALMGTDKKTVSVTELPAELQPAVAKLMESDGDNETKFLKTSAVAFNYYRGGVKHLDVPVSVDKSEDEVKGYCSNAAAALLRDILEEKYNTLIWFWTKCCVEKEQLVQPRILPKYFEWGANTKKTTASLFVQAIGNRGVWLSKFKPEWKFIEKAAEEFDWDTSSIERRVKHLEELRRENSPEALEKIKAVWKEENAANRVELISTLAVNISVADEEFLVSILNDKSKNVKEKALQLVKLIPGAAMIELYKNCLRQSIVLTQSKMLGLISKTSIQVKLQRYDESIFSTGIQKLSPTKEVSDDDYMLMQMIQEVPPSFWPEHFNLSIAEVVKAFTKDELKRFQLYLQRAVLKFNDSDWAKDMLDNFDFPVVGLLPLVNEQDRIRYATRFLKEYPDEVIDALSTGDLNEWNRKFAFDLVTVLADNPHRYNKAFFENIVIYLPLDLTNDLDNVKLVEEWKNSYWAGLKDEVTRLLSIKEQIKKSFL